MKEKHIDPAIPRKRKIIDQTLQIYNGVPLPSVIEISESGKCNRSCSFCPKSDPDYPDVAEFITTDLIQKLTNELSEVNYSGIFVYSGFCEPLLDKNIFNLISITSNNLPNAKIELVTNGDPLNAKRLVKLFDSGLTTLMISAYDDSAQIDFFHDMLQEAGVDKSKVVVRPRFLSASDDFGITLNNRSGALANAAYSIQPLGSPLKKRCNYPSYSFFMDYNGDVLICSHDWRKKYIVGNVNHDSFFDIWTGGKMTNARTRLIHANRAFSPCDVCDANGQIMGNDHALTWKPLLSE